MDFVCHERIFFWLTKIHKRSKKKEEKKEKTIAKPQNLQCIILLNSKTWLTVGTGKKKCLKMTFRGI